MAKNRWRIGGAIKGSKRDLLLRMFKPRLARVYCQSLTWAYGVQGDFLFPDGVRDVRIVGIHRTDTTEALICTVDGEAFRPDGKRFHITLSTAADVAPAQAGHIDPVNIERIEPVILNGVSLTREMLRPAIFEANRHARAA
jgi:hypothetical protein